jgi:hypothetical protein
MVVLKTFFNYLNFCNARLAVDVEKEHVTMQTLKAVFYSKSSNFRTLCTYVLGRNSR